MSEFSADEDKALLLLVVAFEDDNGVIDWDKVVEYLRPTTKTVDDYKQRLQYLKIEDSSQLRNLPSTYLSGSSLMSASTNRSVDEIYEAIEEIFGHLTQADVRQPRGEEQLNSGELAPIGVTAMLQRIDLTSDDTFLDIGSGTGSVLAQVVLQIPVRGCIGLEIKEDLSEKSRLAIHGARSKYPRLHLVNVFTGDIKNLPINISQEMYLATCVYSNNLVFSPEDNLAVSDFLCKSLASKFALLTQRFCARCSPTCTKEFCMSWQEVNVVSAKSCWRDQPVEVYIYKRKSMVDMVSTL